MASTNAAKSRELFDALCKAFPTADDLQRMVSFGLQENLHAIAGGTNDKITNLVFKLIQWAEARGRLDELIAAAYADNSTNPHLQSFYHKYAVAEQESATNIATTPAQTSSPTAPAPQIDQTSLRKKIMEHFNESELKTLCSDMGIDYEIVPGSGKEDRIRELIDYCRRHGKYDALVAMCREQRPHVSWD
jgi:hypothetical protein